MTIIEIAEPYAHLLEKDAPLADLVLAAEKVYAARVEEVTEEAQAGVQVLQEQLETYVLNPQEVHERQEGLQEIAGALSKELFEEFQAARALLTERATERLVVGTAKRLMVFGALVVTGAVVLSDLLRRIR